MSKLSKKKKVRRYTPSIHLGIHHMDIALESLIATLRTHMARLTSEFSSHKTLLDELRTLREADKITLRHYKSGGVTPLAWNVADTADAMDVADVLGTADVVDVVDTRMRWMWWTRRCGGCGGRADAVDAVDVW